MKYKPNQSKLLPVDKNNSVFQQTYRCENTHNKHHIEHTGPHFLSF